MGNDKGLTLLEVLISMLIMAIGILGIAPMVVLSIEGNNISHDVMMASSLAKEKIETYNGSAIFPALPFEQAETDLAGGYSRKTYMWDNTTDSTIADGLCQIKVLISWTDKMGVARSAEYMSIIDKG